MNTMKLNKSQFANDGKPWAQQEAIDLCVELENYAPNFGCHVALSGGCLYKFGCRKDCDIILYRIRQFPTINFAGFFEAIKAIGVTKLSGFGFCHKGIYSGKLIDFLLPEEEGEEYPVIDPADKLTTSDLLEDGIF